MSKNIHQSRIKKIPSDAVNTEENNLAASQTTQCFPWCTAQIASTGQTAEGALYCELYN